MDLDAIAREQRHRQALEALEFERDREAALREQLREVITELEGPRIDQETFARMAPEDVELVRAVLADAADAEEAELFDEPAEGWLLEEAPDPEAVREERLAEITRLSGEIDVSQRRQQAFEHYLAALSNGAGSRGDTARHEEVQMTRLTDDVRQALEDKNFWHMATLNPDGSPQVTPVWAHVRDDRILVNSYFGRKKPRNIEHDPRVALAWHDPESPYHNITIQGRVVDTVIGDQADEDIDALSEKYLGQRPYPWHSPEQRRVSFLIEPEHVTVSSG